MVLVLYSALIILYLQVDPHCCTSTIYPFILLFFDLLSFLATIDLGTVLMHCTLLYCLFGFDTTRRNI